MIFKPKPLNIKVLKLFWTFMILDFLQKNLKILNILNF